MFKRIGKKSIAALVSALIVVGNDLLNKPLSPETIQYLIGLAAVYIIGQGAADFGKNKVYIEKANGG
jgi:hypothetical protein